MRHRLFAAWAVVLAIGLPATLAAQDIGTILPVEEESYHVPMFRNDYVTLLRMLIPPGTSSGYHVHSRDQIGVVVGPYPPKAYSHPLGKAPNAPRFAPLGEVTYLNYYKTPVTHRAFNPDTIPIDVYGIILNSPKPWGFTPGARDVPGYTQVLDNERARGWRLVLEPGQTAPAITQSAPGVRVTIRGGDILQVSPGRRDRAMHPMAREAFWQEPGQTRAVRNIGTTTVEIVEFELK